jgi:signal transduction histidine kinase/CheY-like chemotaxis protein
MGRDGHDGGSNDEVERMRSEIAELRKFKRLIDALPFGVMIFQADGSAPEEMRALYGNASASRHSGMDLSTGAGLPLREVAPAALAAPDSFNIPKTCQRVAERERAELMPAVAFGDTNSRTWFTVHVLPLGERIVASVGEDISARMHAEHEIRALNRELEKSLSDRERRYRSIFAAASVGLIETDLSRVKHWLEALGGAEDMREQLEAEPKAVAAAADMWPIREINDAGLRVIGARDRSDLPRSFGDLLRDASSSAWLDLLLAIASGETRFEAELTLQTAEGERSALLTMSLPRASEEFAHVVVSMLDLTERKRLQRDLWAAQRMEAIGSLTGGVAHDFNNLLMVIGSYAGFMLDQLPEGHSARDDAKVIQDATERAALLTNQLLAFSRRQVQRLEPLNLNDAVAELERMLRRVIGAHIAVQTRRDPELGLVRADRTQIEQVLMNLAINARDAMPKGGTITVETANAEISEPYVPNAGEQVPPGSYVMLALSDTGTGMDEETRLRIFEPFFSTKERGRGTGLGLSTVYGIVKQSGGHIWVHSELGHGTAFKIYLPRIESDQYGLGSDAMSMAPPRGDETVLLVEDEERVRMAARRILERHGYHVLEAGDGEQALRVSGGYGEVIHLMITDMVMPRMSGDELAHKLAALRPAMKVIYVSGYTEDAVTRRGVLEASTAYVQKPFSPASLLRKVREILDG